MTTSVSRDTDRPIRPLPAGCGQQDRYETRTHRITPWVDTVAVSPEPAKRADPAPSKSGALVGLLLVLTGWPLVAVVVALVLFIVEHMPKLPN